MKRARASVAAKCRRYRRRVRAAVGQMAAAVSRAAQRTASTLRRRWQQRAGSIVVEVLVADRLRARELERELRRGITRLRRGLGREFWGEQRTLAVVAQQAIGGERPAAGCGLVGTRPDGRPYALVRLALQVRGRVLTTDEVLAALVEQCVALSTKQEGSPALSTVTAPLEPVSEAADRTAERTPTPAPPRDRRHDAEHEPTTRPRAFAPDPLSPLQARIAALSAEVPAGLPSNGAPSPSTGNGTSANGTARVA
jgi:hypothetical protein